MYGYGSFDFNNNMLGAAGQGQQQPEMSQGGSIYDVLDERNLTHKYKSGLGTKLIDAPLSVFGLTDKDYPFYKTEVVIEDGVARMTDSYLQDGWVLDKKKKGRADAKALGEFAADRINEILKANGLYGQKGLNIPNIRMGGASGRKGSKLGQGLYVGTRGDFNTGAEFTEAKSFRDFAIYLDAYVSDKINRYGANRPNANIAIKELPAFAMSEYPSLKTSLGKIDNTSGIARFLSAAAINTVAGGPLTSGLNRADDTASLDFNVFGASSYTDTDRNKDTDDLPMKRGDDGIWRYLNGSVVDGIVLASLGLSNSDGGAGQQGGAQPGPGGPEGTNPEWDKDRGKWIDPVTGAVLTGLALEGLDPRGPGAPVEDKSTTAGGTGTGTGTGGGLGDVLNNPLTLPLAGLALDIIGGYFGSKAYGDLADANMDAAELAAEVQRENRQMYEKMYNQSRSDFAPWRELGLMGINELKERTLGGYFDPEKWAGFDEATKPVWEGGNQWRQGAESQRNLSPPPPTFDTDAMRQRAAQATRQSMEEYNKPVVFNDQANIVAGNQGMQGAGQGQPFAMPTDDFIRQQYVNAYGRQPTDNELATVKAELQPYVGATSMPGAQAATGAAA